MTALAVQFHLEQTQWWSPERIAQHQYHQLGLLLRHSAQTVPYYRDLFQRAGFDAAKTVTPETWQRIPTLSRRALKQQFQALQSNAVPEDHGAIRSFDTSGSTGAPVVVHKTELQRVFWRANTLRDQLWHKRDLSAAMASIRIFDSPAEAAYPQGVSSSRWGESSAMFATGPGSQIAKRRRPFRLLECASCCGAVCPRPPRRCECLARATDVCRTEPSSARPVPHLSAVWHDNLSLMMIDIAVPSVSTPSSFASSADQSR